MTFERFKIANKERFAFILKKSKVRWQNIDYSNAIAGEAGELCNKIKKLRLGKKIDEKEILDEIADIVIYCDGMATKMGRNLEDIVISKFNEVSDRHDCDIKL